MKRIVICADGTWNSPLQDHPTNVLRIARGIKPTGKAGVRQVVFYDWGVGSDRKSLTGGAFGAGVGKNITDCYRFLVHNYDPGDELYFFGFSRGAYTVRSLAGFMRNCGLLRREHAERIEEAYKLYCKRPASTGPDSPRARAFRAAYAVADLTPIRFMGVFDTVGSLGVPSLFFGLLGSHEELFHDTEPSRIIGTARHALSIDENREDFMPTLWDAKPGLDLEQVWFSGVHSDVGGGYAEVGLCDLALEWMVEQARGADLVLEPYLTQGLAPDALDRQHNERKGIFLARGLARRKLSSAAHIHRSVKERYEATASKRRSKPIKQLLDSVAGDWSRLQLVS